MINWLLDKLLGRKQYVVDVEFVDSASGSRMGWCNIYVGATRDCTSDEFIDMVYKIADKSSYKGKPRIVGVFKL